MADYLLCKHMGWSHDQLLATPMYTRVLYQYFMAMDNLAAQKRQESQRSDGKEVTSHA